MNWYIFVIIVLLLIAIIEWMLIAKKSIYIKKISEFIKTGQPSGVANDIVNAYKSRIDLIEQRFSEEISKLKNENVNLKNELDKKNEIFCNEKRELSEQLSNIFKSIGELTEAFKIVIDEINDVLIKNLENMNQRSNKIVDDIERGRKKVSESVEDISQLLNKIQDLSKDVANLSTHAESISRITQIVNDIVKEISFISLNAQIEANKIKDSMAFSLLASEMRKLAETGKQTLKEINKTISSIVADIEANREQIRNFTDKIEDLGNRTQYITCEFELVQQLVQSVLDYQNELSEQIKQHFTGIQEIVGVLGNIYHEGTKIVENILCKENR